MLFYPLTSTTCLQFIFISTIVLQIHHLAVNALLKSNQINEIKGGTVFGLDQDTCSGIRSSDEQYSSDEGTSCEPAFRVLKQLIQRCLADAIASGNVFADAILQNLYRWLCRSYVYLVQITYSFISSLWFSSSP